MLSQVVIYKSCRTKERLANCLKKHFKKFEKVLDIYEKV